MFIEKSYLYKLAAQSDELYVFDFYLYFVIIKTSLASEWINPNEKQTTKIDLQWK